ncbi:hypothetical protein [Methylobacterium trifolii]|uniref:Uncharacterized protein n=1 Tax=Methylobacterium trifolii TaxID=1003092 RepID=A0ABQ4U1A5_9HYPH|nr:hypothetical protein [Methylobacterium trifolii]GJE60924.1 hypothetical protein MPOCJGCO_3043 [Methylobacterium trifolii]
MSAYGIRIDDDGLTHVHGTAPSLLALFLEDIDQEECQRVLRAVSEVGQGQRERYTCRYDNTHLTVLPDGATFRIAANLTRNEEIPLTLAELVAGLERLRSAFAEMSATMTAADSSEGDS